MSMPFFTFWPSWVADLSSWGHPQSIFFPLLEDSYANFNLGQTVETRGILGVGWIATRVEDGRRHRRQSRIMDWRNSSEGVRQANPNYLARGET